MLSIEEIEIIFGKRWNTWNQDEWDEVLKTTEADDLKFPLIINKVMEAYIGDRKEVLTKSVIEFVDETIRRHKETTQE